MSSSFVVNRQTAWLLYNEAKTWGTRPSELLQITDWYTAFTFDQAINYWGTSVSNALDSVEGKDEKETANKRKQVLQSWIYPDEKPKGTFADPALMFS